jgi:hypothetical protein
MKVLNKTLFKTPLMITLMAGSLAIFSIQDGQAGSITCQLKAKFEIQKKKFLSRKLRTINTISNSVCSTGNREFEISVNGDETVHRCFNTRADQDYSITTVFVPLTSESIEVKLFASIAVIDNDSEPDYHIGSFFMNPNDITSKSFESDFFIRQISRRKKEILTKISLLCNQELIH